MLYAIYPDTVWRHTNHLLVSEKRQSKDAKTIYNGVIENNARVKTKKKINVVAKIASDDLSGA